MKTIEKWCTDIVGGLGPWLAPVPSAALVFWAMQVHFVWATPIVALCGAAVIEVLGFSAINTALMLHEWNGRRPAGEKAAPFGMAAVIVGVYLAATIGLTVVLELEAGLVRVAPALFPVLALVGSVNIALRTGHAQRLQRIEEAAQAHKLEEEKRKAERKAERQARVQARPADSGKVSENVSNNGTLDMNQDRLQAGRRARKTADVNTMLNIFRENPNTEISDVARRLGRSRTTIYSYLGELEQAGRVHVNGNGVEVGE